ncbi:MAG: hypothetical protein K2O29_02310 [Ruminococcus sp.]|nr:hypothetical protein [Ruminococcus sp.]MDE6849243.1 hypothetical protein [Ruminococcus sp.]MDE7137281.1 hypothetical protein [Ruminococcus sp.]
MDKERCKFAGVSRYCMILVGRKCVGDAKNCSFYKTERQFAKAADRAVLINREKGNCKKCRYNKIPCEVSAGCLKERRGGFENNSEY